MHFPIRPWGKRNVYFHDSIQHCTLYSSSGDQATKISKRHLNWKERIQSLLTDDTIFSMENPEKSTHIYTHTNNPSSKKAQTKQNKIKTLLELIIKFSTVARYKRIIQKSLYFYTLAVNNLKMKLRKQSHSPLNPNEQSAQE